MRNHPRHRGRPRLMTVLWKWRRVPIRVHIHQVAAMEPFRGVVQMALRGKPVANQKTRLRELRAPPARVAAQVANTQNNPSVYNKATRVADARMIPTTNPK